MQKATKDRRYTIDEAAEFLGVARQTLYNWRYKGIGPPFVKLGGKVVYRGEDLARWMKEGDK